VEASLAGTAGNQTFELFFSQRHVQICPVKKVKKPANRSAKMPHRIAKASGTIWLEAAGMPLFRARR
jgi:hypothetical protein